MKYDNIIFVCKNNTFLSPLIEAIYRNNMEDGMPEAFSRGLVVLFEEPVSPKVNLLLTSHGYNSSNHEMSRQLQKNETTPHTLIITMTLPEKVRYIDDFCGEAGEGSEENVYTLGEYTGVEIDVQDPYGSDSQAYEQCFEDLLERVLLLIERLARLKP